MTQALEPEYGNWLVLATHPYREAQAIENLVRQSFHVFCPMTLTHIRHARRAYDAKRPLFPGYVFVEQPSLQQQWRPLLGTSGVRTVLMSGERPAKLPAGFIESLKAREVDGSICKPVTPFQIGQRVTIQGGPFDGIAGQIIEMREHDRILVLLDLLKRQTRVHIDAKRLM
ncbi:MAG: transcription termination/antitermination protein NusG [Rhodomicrobium sp.]